MFNKISDEGCKAIGAGLAGSRLTTLHLEDNDICDEGCKAIAAGLAGSQLTTLGLMGNKISDKDLTYIDAALKRNSEWRKRFLVVGWRVCVNAWRV
jgi:hypothetical protein